MLRPQFLAPVIVLANCLFLPAAEITGVNPSLVLAANLRGDGGTAVAVVGSGFSRGDTIKVGGEALLGEVNDSSTLITGRIPNLSPRFYGVQLFSATGLLLTGLSRAVEVTAPVTVT